MSYDVSIVDADGKCMHSTEKHDFAGGTYVLGGTTALELNVTYNYGAIIRRVLHEDGLRWLQGKRVADTLAALVQASVALGNDAHPDYWQATEGNVKNCLLTLVCIGARAPTGYWEVD